MAPRLCAGRKLDEQREKGAEGRHQKNRGQKMSTVTEYRNLLSSFVPRVIDSDAEYRRALDMLERMMTPKPSRAASQFIELLSALIENYESIRHPTPRMPPAKLLKHLIETRGLKQVDVAKQSGVDVATLSNVMANRRAISKTNSLRLAKYFGVNAEAFLEPAARAGAPGDD
jgi:HTH-type transcriptional regulator/antitoxin HigA